jgi:hypothetical protein
MTYAELEAKMFSGPIAQSQGGRINLRLQIAFNYCVSKELEMGEPLTNQQLSDGLVNGMLAMLANLAVNTRSKILPQMILVQLLKAYQSDFDKYLSANELLGTFAEINPHKGTA